jgi:capsular polysaccharide biosynthesis protein
VKLYLTRSTGEGRRARNEDELVEVTRAHGFSAVDPGVLSWPAQVDLFRRASHVVGVHGAAFTNVLFRWPAPLRILEIESPHGSEDVFRSMATELGFEMTSLRGTNPSDSSNRPEFDVDATAVDRVLRRWTDEPAPRDPSIATVGG